MVCFPAQEIAGTLSRAAWLRGGRVKAELGEKFRPICFSKTGKAYTSFSLNPNSFAKAPLLCPSAVGSPPGPLQPKGKVSPDPAD